MNGPIRDIRCRRRRVDMPKHGNLRGKSEDGVNFSFPVRPVSHIVAVPHLSLAFRPPLLG